MKPFLAVLGLSAWAAQAHVTLISPEGGEAIPGGSTFTVVWDADDHDCVYHIYYSADGGSKWSVVALDINQNTRTHKWQVPDSATTQGMIRILQDNKTGTDLDDKSGTFKVTAGSGVVRFHDPGRKVEAAFSADRTSIALDLAAATEAAIEVFDARGVLVETWLRAKLPAGAHRLAFPGAAPAALVRIRLDGWERTFQVTRAD